MSREEEYKQKCRQVKDYYLEEICEHEDAGCLGDAENARKWRRAELEELDRQYREGEPLTGCGIALHSRGCSRGIRWGALFHGKAM